MAAARGNIGLGGRIWHHGARARSQGAGARVIASYPRCRTPIFPYAFILSGPQRIAGRGWTRNGGRGCLPASQLCSSVRMVGCSAQAGFATTYTSTWSHRPRLRSRSSLGSSSATRPDGFTRPSLIDGTSGGSVAMERLRSAGLTMQPCATISATRSIITGNGRLRASICRY